MKTKKKSNKKHCPNNFKKKTYYFLKVILEVLGYTRDNMVKTPKKMEYINQKRSGKSTAQTQSLNLMV